MVSGREHRRLQERFVFMLFSIPLAAAAFAWSELGRRLEEIAKDTAKRREFEEIRFGNIENAQRDNAAKAAGAQEAAKAAREAREEGWRPWSHRATIAVAIATIVSVGVTAISYHLF